MIAERIPLRGLKGERYFRWRGGDVSRLEALADGVIALSMTLLIVSLEVPRDFAELLASFAQVPAFAICFVLLVLVWYYHYQFHRRFGLENAVVLWLNAGLLFLVLLYVYPLKFLFTELAGALMSGSGRVGFEDGRTLMLLYSSGVTGIFLLFTLMNLYAYRHRDALALNAVEREVARGTIRAHVIHTAVGAASVVLALAGRPALSGLIYFAIGPAQFANGLLWGRRVDALTAADPPA